MHSGTGEMIGAYRFLKNNYFTCQFNDKGCFDDTKQVIIIPHDDIREMYNLAYGASVNAVLFEGFAEMAITIKYQRTHAFSVNNVGTN